LNIALSGHTGAVNTLAWAPNGKYLASGGRDQKVRVWGVVTGKELHVYSHRTGEVNALAWSPDSTHLASAGDDHLVHLWSVR
jgi:WD40 repeat protein